MHAGAKDAKPEAHSHPKPDHDVLPPVPQVTQPREATSKKEKDGHDPGTLMAHPQPKYRTTAATADRRISDMCTELLRRRDAWLGL